MPRQHTPPPRRLGLLLLALLGACVGTNPAYEPAASASAASSGPAVQSSGAEPNSESTTGAQPGLEGGAAPAGATSGASDSSTSGGAASTGWSTSSSGVGSVDTGTTQDSDAPLQPSDLGQACAAVDGCGELGVGAQCCESAQCLGTCMVPCTSEDDCPFAGMGCEHDYCLFPCDANDDDCADWSGFTCQHGGRFCEND